MKTKRILVIDDEPSITRTMKVNLERSGAYSVCTENHADRALETARRFQPDLIFLDVMMPEIDGGHLAAQIGSDRSFKGVPVSLPHRDRLREGNDRKRKDDCRALLPRQTSQPRRPNPVHRGIYGRIRAGAFRVPDQVLCRIPRRNLRNGRLLDPARRAAGSGESLTVLARD